MLMRVRSQEKCDSAVVLTSNLLVSLVFSSGIKLTPIFYPNLALFAPGHPIFARSKIRNPKLEIRNKL